jgi:hypothetical protein
MAGGQNDRGRRGPSKIARRFATFCLFILIDVWAAALAMLFACLIMRMNLLSELPSLRLYSFLLCQLLVLGMIQGGRAID